MTRRSKIRCAAAMSAAAILTTATGCDPATLAATGALTYSSLNFGAFAAGWLARDMTTTSTSNRECYQNNVQVDCSTLPQGQ